MRFCLASGIAFGAMAVFGKLAYAEGATVGTLLAIRFTLASGLFWVGPPGAGRAARRARRARPRRRAMPSRRAAISRRCSASTPALLALLVYTFPAFVALAGRERLTRRRASPLALSLGGLALVVGAAGALDPLGVALALATGDALRRVHPRQRRDRAARAAADARRARLQRRGGRAAARDDRARAVPATAAHRGRLGLDRLPRGDLDGRRDRAVLRRPQARRADDRGDPRDRRAARDGRARVPRLRRGARTRSSSRAARSCWPRSA